MHLCIDTTGSFGGEINALQSSLHATIIPELRARVPDLMMGVSRFADFPVLPFGAPSDHVYDLLTPLTNDFVRVGYGVNALSNPLQNGADGPEAWGEALFQIGTGLGLRINNIQYIPTFSRRSEIAAGVGFREGSARVVVAVTDAPTHEPADYESQLPGTHGTLDAIRALAAVNAHIIGIASGTAARPQLEALALGTGATDVPTGGRCQTGVNGSTRAPSGDVCPLVYDIMPDGTGLARTLVDGIVRYLSNLAFHLVQAEVSGDPQGFVTAVEAQRAEAPVGDAAPAREDRQPDGHPDGVPDTFVDVTSHTRTTFRVHLRNTTVPIREQPQVFFVSVGIFGDRVLLSTRTVRIIVPEGPKPDAAVDAPDARDASDVASDDAGGDVGGEASVEALDASDDTTEVGP